MTNNQYLRHILITPSSHPLHIFSATPAFRRSLGNGPLATVDFGELECVDGRMIRVTFSNNTHANRLNYVILVAYLPEKRNCMLSEPVFRSTGMAEITLPEAWTGCPSHIYGFCWDGKDTASPSSHIGTVNNTSN